MAPLDHARNGALAADVSALLHAGARERGLRLVNPFNLGAADDVRGPDLGVVRRDQPLELYMPTAEIVVEVLSPGDETWQKLSHYAAHGVGEVWVVDPDARTVRLLVLEGADYAERGASALTSFTRARLEAELDWPE